MALSAGSLLTIFAICWTVAYLGKRGRDAPATYRDRVRDALLKLVREVGWAALAAALIALSLSQALSFDAGEETIADINAFVARADEYLKWSWAVTLLLAITALVAFAVVRKDAARTNADGAGRAIRWLGALKGLFALLATSSFVGAEANATIPAKLSQAKEARQKLTEAQLLLFRHAQVALIREAMVGALEQTESGNLPVRKVSAAYATAAPLISPALGSSTINGDAVAAGFRDAPANTAKDLSAASASDLRLQTDAMLSRQTPQEKLIDDIFQVALDRAQGEIKSRYLNLGNPILHSLLEAFSGPALDPIREAAAKQANALLAGRLNLSTAAANMRAFGRKLAARLVPGRTVINTRSADVAGFGATDWNAVRERIAAAAAEGIRGKSPVLQNQARKVVGDAQRMEENVKLLLFAAPNRQTSEEAAFARYLATNPAYAALWGYGVISVPPPRLMQQLKDLSVSGNEERAARIQLAIGLANAGSSAMAAIVRKYGLDPTEDRGLSVPAIQTKIFAKHGAFPEDGYSLYFSDVGTSAVDEARTYYESEKVGYWVNRICPAEQA